MKKIKYLLFTLAILLISGTVNAGSITPTAITKANYDGNFTIEGTGTGQIQIVLFDLENKPLYMTTVLAENDKFSIELPKIDGIENGNYKVKIANYNGTSVDSESILVAKTNPITTPTEDENPKTIDNLTTFITVGVISLIGLSVGSIYLKKRYN